MKKFFYSLLLLATLLAPAAVTSFAGAADPAPICNNVASHTQVCGEINNGTLQNPIINDLKVALNIISIVAGFGAVIMVVLGGIKLTTANGDPSSIKTGRDQIIYALIGVVVVIFSQAIVAFVLNKIG